MNGREVFKNAVRSMSDAATARSTPPSSPAPTSI